MPVRVCFEPPPLLLHCFLTGCLPSSVAAAFVWASFVQTNKLKGFSTVWQFPPSSETSDHQQGRVSEQEDAARWPGTHSSKINRPAGATTCLAGRLGSLSRPQRATRRGCGPAGRNLAAPAGVLQDVGWHVTVGQTSLRKMRAARRNHQTVQQQSFHTSEQKHLKQVT